MFTYALWFMTIQCLFSQLSHSFFRCCYQYGQPKCIYVNAWEFCQKASLFAPWCTSNQLNLTPFPTQPPSPPGTCTLQPTTGALTPRSCQYRSLKGPETTLPKRPPNLNSLLGRSAIRLQPKETFGVQTGGDDLSSPRCLDPIKSYLKKNPLWNYHLCNVYPILSLKHGLSRYFEQEKLAEGESLEDAEPWGCREGIVPMGLHLSDGSWGQFVHSACICLCRVKLYTCGYVYIHIHMSV